MKAIIIMFLFFLVFFLIAVYAHHACASETQDNCSECIQSSGVCIPTITIPIPTSEYLPNIIPTEIATPSATIQPTIIPTAIITSIPGSTETPTPVAGSSASVIPTNTSSMGNVIPQNAPNTGRGE